MRRGQDTGDIDASYSYPLVDPRLEEAHDDGTVVQCTGADRSLVQSLDVMDNPLYSQHLKGNERDDEQDANDLGARQGDERDYDQDAIDPGSRQDDEQDDDRDEINQRGGDVYEGGGAGLVVWVKDKGTGRSEGARAKRITRGLKVNVGGEELNLHHNTGSSTRVFKPQHLYGIWFGLTPYRLPLDTLSEYQEP